MAPRVILHRSNRIELLVDGLAELLGSPVGSPFDPEWIVVQGRGMSVWLAQELSRRLGIWATESFVYPKNFVARAFEVVLGEAPSEAYGRDGLVFGILAALARHRDDPALAPLARYVASDPAHGAGAGARAHQLAQRIAEAFDQYLTYRPEMLRRWSEGIDGELEPGDRWQPMLWRALEAAAGPGHAAHLEKALLDRLLLARPAAIEGLPPRLAVFGLPSLPPLYVRILGALAAATEVHWYLPLPAEGYWGDLVSPKKVAVAEAAGASIEALHLDVGHPLLGSLGKLGADLQDVIVAELEDLGVALEERDAFAPPEAQTSLGALQRDILEIAPRKRTQPLDDSISLAACHGPMREVEVLQDRLLALLADDPTIGPRDIVVMMPDVEAYAPLVEAVFELPAGDPRFIPYRIADRSMRGDSAVVDAFSRLLALAGGRARASELLDLLSLEPVRRRFAIDAAEVESLRGWVVESGIRWGIDADHRQRHGQPREHRNTWRFGLERLLLGYALPTAGKRLFAGALPYDEIEGSAADLLGKLSFACERLFAAIEAIEVERPLEAWQPVLLGILEGLLVHDDANAWEHQRIREGIETMVEAARAASFGEPLGIEAVRALLEIHVEAGQPARGFLAGGVTFCAMVPMRSIPFAVVCLLGMSDGAFPRQSRSPGFDLVARAPRRGDRSRRDDDRYLFLEAIVSARKHLIVSYVGRSPRDDASLPPAPVVGELVDALAEAHFEGPREERRARARAALTVEHPLSPYSPRYFDGSDPRLFSFASEYVAAAARLGSERKSPPLFDAPLADAPLGAIELHELLAFFDNPVRYLFESRLGVSLRDEGLDVPDREPIELFGLEKHALGERLLDLRLEGVATDQLGALAAASGALPYGAAGRCDLDAVLALVEPLAKRVADLRGEGRERDLTLEVRLPGGVIVSGAVGDRWQAGLVRHQFAQVSGKHLLSLWIRHLAQCLVAVAPSHLVGRPSPLLFTKARASSSPVHTYRFEPLAREEAARHLDDLVALYRLGRTEPLLLFPKSALAQAAIASEDVAPPARKIFDNSEWRFDPHLQRLFADSAVLSSDSQPFGMPRSGPSFADLALRVFGPLRAALRMEP